MDIPELDGPEYDVAVFADAPGLRCTMSPLNMFMADVAITTALPAGLKWQIERSNIRSGKINKEF